jgi:SHS2 domain-containing protein
MPYKFIDGVAIADVAFEASGKTIEAMFVSAGEALMNTQVNDLKKITPAVEKKFELSNKDEERLLHDFLQELIFLKDAELLLFREYNLKIAKLQTGEWKLKASLRGEQIDQKKHELLVDVKAVSWHMFKIEKTKTGWKAFVILDV